MLKPNGCNGWSYDLSYLEEPNISSDAVFYGIIAVDPMTFSYVEEINIDWEEDGLNEQFKISSPQETAQCPLLLRPALTGEPFRRRYRLHRRSGRRYR